jgi:DNA-binding winged helix-turn-helix (wHTH) protein
LEDRLLYAFEGYVLDTARRELRQGATVLAVEPQVFDLLAYLIENRERVVSKDDLRMSVWEGRVVSESTQSYYINAARTVVGDNGEDQRLIRTFPRRGFRFVAPVQEQDGSWTAPAAAAGDDGSLPVKRPGEAVEPIRTPHMVLKISAGIALAAIAVISAIWFFGRGGGPVSNASVPSGQKFDASVVPLIDDESRRNLASYPNRSDFKALAITDLGWAVSDGAQNVESAKEEALRRCNAKTKRDCRLYAVGLDVVWSNAAMPLPAMSDIRFEPLDTPLVPDEIPLLDRNRRDGLAKSYMRAPNHRALAMSRGGTWTTNTKATRAEAARLALERCAEYWQRPCLLLSVDGMLTLQIPRSRQVVSLFLPSIESELTGGDKERISKIYRGADWRALARGKNGSWHAVAAAPSEAAAVEAALKLCAQADQECRLFAIGNFRVLGE